MNQENTMTVIRELIESQNPDFPLAMNLAEKLGAQESRLVKRKIEDMLALLGQ